MKTIVGLFENEQNADAAIRELQRDGFDRNRFGVITQNRVMQKVNREEEIQEGPIQAESKLGPAGGATVGGLTGLLFGLGALLIPGIGPVVATGAIAAAVGGAGIGAAAGGLLGALTSQGITEEGADFYAEGIKRGGVLVIVEAEESHVPLVKEVMQKHGVVEISARRKDWQAAGWTGYNEAVTPDENYPRL
ncbi:MAG: hypothetical protein L6R45_26905 [Anaerolineae bacterium]|nr:hypothetical protein [Anaerolineae bacterium]